MDVQSRGWMPIAAMLLGCGPAIPTDDGAGTDDPSDTTSAGDTATTSAGTTAGTTASTTAGTTATSSTGTTGVPSGCAADFVGGCQAYCAATITCNPDSGDYEECVTVCVADLAELTAECQVLFCEAYACAGALDCATLEQGSPECDALAAKADEVCGGVVEKCAIGFGPDGGCEHVCGGAVERRLSCNGGTCTCFEDDIELAICPADGICDNLDALDAYEAACCGW